MRFSWISFSVPRRSPRSSSEFEGVPVWDSDLRRFAELLARLGFVTFRRDVVSATWEGVNVDSFALGMAAACFSGWFCTLGRDRGGIIDCGTGFFSDVVFDGGDFGGSAGSGGNGGCAASVLRLSKTGGIFPVTLFTVTGLGLSVCFLFVPGCVDSERVCFVSSCTMSTSSASHGLVLRSGLVMSGFSCGFTVAFSALSAPIRGKFPFSLLLVLVE